MVEVLTLSLAAHLQLSSPTHQTFYLLLLFPFNLLNSFSCISERLFQTHVFLTWQSINHGLMCHRHLKGPWGLHRYIIIYLKLIFLTCNSSSTVCYDYSWIVLIFSIIWLSCNNLLDDTWFFQRPLTRPV